MNNLSGVRYKVAFLDRDGVINVKLPEGSYVKFWGEFSFLRGAIQGVKLLNEAGYKIIIVTNQRGIAKGIMCNDDVDEIHQKMLETIVNAGGVIEAVYYCPHDRGECNCRKPGIGMFLQAEKQVNIDKRKSFMIGDSLTDIEAGEKYGIDAYLLKLSDSLEDLVKKILLWRNDVG